MGSRKTVGEEELELLLEPIRTPPHESRGYNFPTLTSWAELPEVLDSWTDRRWRKSVPLDDEDFDERKEETKLAEDELFHDEIDLDL